jgi:fimbrial chaperone protein
MRGFKVLLAFTLLAPSAIASVQAQSLRVSPVTVELPAGAESIAFTLETDGNELGVQARVFRWSQSGGEDKLEKTEDVVVSPPVLKVHSGASSTLRLVRLTKTPVSGEETYRVLIDEIPDRKKLQAGRVAFNIRQSVPVFFAGVDARPGAITWKAVTHGGKLAVEATNGGQKRVQVRTLSVTDEGNRDLLKNGWGYVLKGQSKKWELQPGTDGARTLTVKAESDVGPINASVSVGKGG